MKRLNVEGAKKTEILLSDFEREYEIMMDKIYVQIDDEMLKKSIPYMKQIYEYNVLSMKPTKGLYLLRAFRILCPKEDEEYESAIVMAWIMEITLAWNWVLEDIMDYMETRRGVQSWHKKVGMCAINDSLLMQQHCYELNRLYFNQKPYYTKLFECFNQMLLYLVYGRMMDMNPDAAIPDLSPDKETAFEWETRKKDIGEFNRERMEGIWKFKTSFYGLFHPIKLLMIITSKDSEEDLEICENLFTKIGFLLNIQDDFLGCYRDPAVTDPIGVDIERGRCTWPIVKALEICDSRQRYILYEHYSVRDEYGVIMVKDVYDDLMLKELFDKEVKALRREIIDEIENFEKLHPKSGFPKQIFQLTMNYIETIKRKDI